jgi:hypothetical protein
LSFLAELRRRHVIKVTLAYIVMAWLILQVADVFLANLGLPDWAFKLVLLLLILGFPVIIMFSWAYDLGREGITRTDAPVAAAPATAPADREIPSWTRCATMRSFPGCWRRPDSASPGVDRRACLPARVKSDKRRDDLQPQVGRCNRWPARREYFGGAMLFRSAI